MMMVARARLRLQESTDKSRPSPIYHGQPDARSSAVIFKALCLHREILLAYLKMVSLR